MLKKIYIITFLFPIALFSQIDYSDKWEDFFSYNQVNDFELYDNKIYAISENTAFIYNILDDSYQKISSVNGLSGEKTSTMFYDSDSEKFIIGYKNGLIETINSDGTIKINKDIVNLAQPGTKNINHFFKYENILFISTPFAIIEYQIDNLEFGDTFYIGAGSSAVHINQIAVKNDIIYAATVNGIYSANVNAPFLIDFNNWQQPQGSLVGNFKTITIFNDEIYVSKGNDFFRLNSNNSLTLIQNFSQPIINVKASESLITITLETEAHILNDNLNSAAIAQSTAEFNFTLNNSFSQDGIIYLATNRYGVLIKDFSENNYIETHPDGPLYNDVFSIEAEKGHLWAVYGGQNYSTYNFTYIKKGFSHFNGENWINTRFEEFGKYNLLDISIDPFDINHIFISSYYHGLIEIQDDEIVNFYNQDNSSLETWFYGIYNNPNAVLVSATDFDSEGNLWIANSHTNNRLKKFNKNGNWSQYSFADLITANKFGLGDLMADKMNNIWIGTRASGVLIFNENGEKTAKLDTNIDSGNLPSNMVKSFDDDLNRNVWIGTTEGFRVLRGVSQVFDTPKPEAVPIKIKLEGATGNEQAQIVLGEQAINSIAIDGADNKWFGTNNSGVLGTNPSATESLYVFNKDNSPLPSNTINKIKIDNSTGMVYFATANGIVAFNAGVAPFGDELSNTYAYPNPVTKNDEFVTIDGLNGKHLPRGTNVKILDSAGYLVYETNVIEGQELKGGKVIWNKRNLAGNKVASGVYIVLLIFSDTGETSTTNIAIIN
jgi:hypothetical protein